MRRGVRICCFIGGFRWLWGCRGEDGTCFLFSIFFFFFFWLTFFVCFAFRALLLFSVVSGMGN